MMRRPTVFALVAALLFASPLQAQMPLQPGTLPPPMVSAVQPSAPVLRPFAGQPIQLPAGTGILLSLPKPAATVMSAEPEVARVQPASPTSLFLMGVAPGRTTVIATTEAGTPIVQYDVTVLPGANGKPSLPELGGLLPPAGPPPGPVEVSPETAAAIRKAITQTTPGASIEVRPAGSQVIITGSVPTPLAAHQAETIAKGYLGDKGVVVDKLDVLGSIQVNVRVRFAEISRQITRQLGFNWQAFGTIGQIGKYPAINLNAPGTYGGTAATLASGVCAAGAALSLACLGGSINGIIDALASDNLITILAEPNLTALSGESASFLAGGEFPIPVAGSTSNGTSTVTVQFQQYGVSLVFIPTVLSDNRLNLRIRPEVSQLSSAGAVSVPMGSGTLTVQSAETTIELGSGESFAIAGLLQRTTNQTLNALPGIGELPVIGALFRSVEFQRGDAELVIVVTPYIVRPVASPGLLQTPLDHFQPATDLDALLFGRQIARGASGGQGAPSQGAGFILK